MTYHDDLDNPPRKFTAPIWERPEAISWAYLCDVVGNKVVYRDVPPVPAVGSQAWERIVVNRGGPQSERMVRVLAERCRKESK